MAGVKKLARRGLNPRDALGGTVLGTFALMSLFCSKLLSAWVGQYGPNQREVSGRA